MSYKIDKMLIGRGGTSFRVRETLFRNDICFFGGEPVRNYLEDK
jgi:hypothetical protein